MRPLLRIVVAALALAVAPASALDLGAIRTELANARLRTWLLCDFHGSDPSARRMLGLDDDAITTRRWCYAIPARGEPLKLVHAIEPAVLDRLPGEKVVYRTWQSFGAGVRRLARLGGRGRVAMSYSPDDAIPYVDRAPAGLVELVRKAGVEVVSSADLVQQFEATLSDRELESHRTAAAFLVEKVDAALARAAAAACAGAPLTERALQQWLVGEIEAAGLIFDHPPIVAVGPNAADPHFVPPADGSAPMPAGSLVLIDAWAKQPEGAYGDVTRMAWLGAEAPETHRQRFAVVLEAQAAAVEYLRAEIASGRSPRAFRADRAARRVIEKAGHGDAFLHRTGHSITDAVHGNGAHLDDLETHDTRSLLPRTCFSVEPGIYYAGDSGYRSEIDVCLVPAAEGTRVEITTPRQTALPALGCPP